EEKRHPSSKLFGRSFKVGQASERGELKVSVDRREFVKSGAPLVGLKALKPRSPLGNVLPSSSSGIPLGRMAWAAGTWCRPYVSKVAHSVDTATWLQIDLGASRPIHSVR